MPALGVEEAELRDAQVLDISVTVENGERVAALEHTGAIVRQGGGRAHVIFVGDSDDVRQIRPILKRFVVNVQAVAALPSCRVNSGLTSAGSSASGSLPRTVSYSVT